MYHTRELNLIGCNVGLDSVLCMALINFKDSRYSADLRVDKIRYRVQLKCLQFFVTDQLSNQCELPCTKIFRTRHT